jgi:hypothetical protein
MACQITAGRLLGCKAGRGGIKNIFFANYDNYGFVVTGQEVTSLGSLGVDEVFQYEVKATVNTLTETGTASDDTGNFVNMQSLAVTLPRMSADLQAQVQLICAGRPIVFVEDYNGNILAVGYTAGTSSNCTKVTGGAAADLNGFTLTVTAEESDLSPFLDSSMITALRSFVSDVVVS